MPGRALRLPSLGELEALVAAVDEGSLAGAARRLRLTRPAVAKRLDNLDALAGEPLLARSERGVHPTPRGRAVLADATRLLADAAALLGRPDATGDLSGLQRLLGRPESLPRPELILHETETLFARVFHTSADAIVISDPGQGTLIEVSDSFCALTGFERAELLGRTSVELDMWVDRGDRDGLVARLRRDEVIRGDSRIRRRDGRVVDVEYAAHLLALNRGFVLLIRLDDATGQRAAERAARRRAQMHERLNALAARLLRGGDPDVFTTDALRALGEGLGVDAALVRLGERPLPVLAYRDGTRVARLVAELGLPPDELQPLVVDGAGSYAVQWAEAAPRPRLVVAAWTETANAFGPEESGYVAAVASMVAVARALAEHAVRDAARAA